LYFGTDILSLAGVKDPTTATISLGIAKILGVVACLLLVDRPNWGRRKLLLIGTIGTVVCHVLLGISFLPDGPAFILNIKPILTLVILFSFIFFWDISWAALMFVIISDALPNTVRGFGTGIAIGVFWSMNFTIGQTMEMLFSHIPPYQHGENPQHHPAGTFFLFAGTSSLSLLFVYFFVVEAELPSKRSAVDRHSISKSASDSYLILQNQP